MMTMPLVTQYPVAAAQEPPASVPPVPQPVVMAPPAAAMPQPTVAAQTKGGKGHGGKKGGKGKGKTEMPPPAVPTVEQTSSGPSLTEQQMQGALTGEKMFFV